MNDKNNMRPKAKRISTKLIIAMAVILCFAMVVFEAGQQLFYLKLYNIGSPTVSFNDVLLAQFRKWLVWVVFSMPLWVFIKSLAEKDELSTTDIYRVAGVIFVLLALVILLMSAVEIIINDIDITAWKIWQEYMVFYTFQKVPIYLFGYTFLSLVFYLYCKNNQLFFQVLNLNQLNKKELQQYYQQQTNADQETSVLKIKVGTTYKIISIEDIDWIEADDYCVNIHSTNKDAVYSMRSTLKSLESLLPENFLRVHRSAIVNMKGVAEYKTQGSGLIKMKSGEQIAVAQSKLKLVNAFYRQETL